MASAEEVLGQLSDVRTPRGLGIFAHPDDEVFCVGGTMARWKEVGATTRLVSLTQGEAGQIRDASIATRRTLGRVRVGEHGAAASALGVDSATCLDLGDGTLEAQLEQGLSDRVAQYIVDFDPDVVVTFGLDGGYGHPDHIASAHATARALSDLGHGAQLLHAVFPMNDQLLLEVIVRWLRTLDGRFAGSTVLGHALKLFADGSSMLGFAADHIDVEWFPAGSFIIEQGEAPRDLYCILSGIALGRPRNAHVVARDDVTCLVLTPQARGFADGRGGPGVDSTARSDRSSSSAAGRSLPPDAISVELHDELDAKVAALAALAAHRSQYALSLDLFQREILRQMLGVEHFVAVDASEIADHPLPTSA